MKTPTCPPSGVNLMAFASRFQMTCCNRPGSPSIVRGPAAVWNVSPTFLAVASERTASSAACATLARSTGSTANRIVPARMRDVSSRSSTMCASAEALRPMAASACSARSRGSCDDSSRRVHPSTAFKGVRNSWDTVARNSSLR